MSSWGGAGSVRRARERLEADLASSPDVARHAATGSTSSSGSSSSRSNLGGIGSSISRPTPMPQWPLREDIRTDTSSDVKNKNRGPPPQRPPRPSHVPSILDSSKIQEFVPSVPQRAPEKVQGQSDYWDDDYQPSPSSNYETSPSSSAPATTSISDFPVPVFSMANLAPVQNRNLMPPKRGPPSYYGFGPNVSPIPEESENGSVLHPRSFASSKVIPSSWGTAPIEAEKIEEYDDSESERSRNSSQSSNSDTPVALVRQASIGKRHKASLKTITTMNDGSSKKSRESEASKNKTGLGIQANPGNASINESPMGTRYPRRPSVGQFSASSTSSSEVDFEKIPVILRPEEPVDERSGLTGPNTLKPSPSFSDKARPRRPPRLNMNAVKEAEVRGSLTSLPDLILRATRLAANLDRGKTASRLGMWDLFNGSSRNSRDVKGNQRSSGLSDMLNSFPPPGVNTPNGEKQSSRWPSPIPGSRLAHSQNARDLRTPPKVRRYCGMQPQVFCLLLLLLIILVIAAIVIPIVFLVILPNNETSSSKSRSNGACSSTLICYHGGESIILNHKCRCICINGYSGEHCNVAPDSDCVTSDIVGTNKTYYNATIGSSIPDLLVNADADYEIPLEGPTILTLFTASNLSCSTENDLVTFNGKSSKRSPAGIEEPEAAVTTALARLVPRESLIRAETTLQQARTSNGIVFAVSATPTATATATTTTTKATATSTSSASSSSSNSDEDSLTSYELDFARVVVLYVLQRTRSLDAAITAQENIQDFLSLDFSATANLSLGNDYKMNFGKYEVILPNGSTVGGG